MQQAAAPHDICPPPATHVHPVCVGQYPTALHTPHTSLNTLDSNTNVEVAIASPTARYVVFLVCFSAVRCLCTVEGVDVEVLTDLSDAVRRRVRSMPYVEQSTLSRGQSVEDDTARARMTFYH
jgi:hypothetical protein